MYLSRLTQTSLKSTLLATVLLWSLAGILEGASTEALPFIFLSTIPIFIICFFAILFTIAPFQSMNEGKMEDKNIFKRFFPYYAIIAFGISTVSILSTNFDSFAVIFFTTAFFTAMQSWVWFFKAKKI